MRNSQPGDDLPDDIRRSFELLKLALPEGTSVDRLVLEKTYREVQAQCDEGLSRYHGARVASLKQVLTSRRPHLCLAIAFTVGIAATLLNFASMAPDLTKAAGVGLTGVILSALGSQLKVFQLPKESRGLEDAGRMSQQVSTLIGDTYKQLAELVQSTQNPASLANAEMILSTLERVREVTTNQVNAENGIRLKISKETNNAMSASIAIWGIAWVVSVGIMIAVVSDALSLLVFVATSANGAFQIIRGKLVDDPVYQV